MGQNPTYMKNFQNVQSWMACIRQWPIPDEQFMRIESKTASDYHIPFPFMNINHILFCGQSWADTGGMDSIAGLAPLSWYTAIHAIELCAILKSLHRFGFWPNFER